MNSKKQHKWGSNPDLSGPWHFYRERLITKYLTGVLIRGHILDCGFGSGSLAIKLAKTGFQVTGVENSDKFIEHMQCKLRYFPFREKITIQKGDITNLNFSDEYFDGVVCGEVLEHIKEDKSAILELYRVMKKGGFCVITVPAMKSLWSCVDEWAGHYRRYSRQELKELLEKGGFIIKKLMYYGFPVGLLYHKFVFLPIFRRRLRKEGEKKSPATKKTFNQFYIGITKVLSYIFYLDHLVPHHQRGTGIIVVCQKQES